MDVGLRTYDRQGNLVVGIDTRFVKIVGHINVSKTHQGVGTINYRPPAESSLQIVAFAVPTQTPRIYATPLVVRVATDGFSYFFHDSAQRAPLFTGNDTSSLMERVDYKVYYGYI